MTWIWESVVGRLGADALLSVLNQRMKTLEQFLSRAVGEFRVDAKAYTTDATVTTLATELVQVSETLHVVGYVVGRRTGGSSGTANDSAHYRVEFLGKNAAGTAALAGGAATVTTLAEDQAGWAVTGTASGGNILVRVTGAADNNVTWVWTRRRVSVTNAT